jgi:hypothetical protein
MAGTPRPWWRKKRFIIPAAAVALLVLIVIATGGGNEATDTGSSSPAGGRAASTAGGQKGGDTRNLSLYPDRPDRHAEDHEARVGDAVRLAGYTAAVTGAELATDALGDRVLVVHVTVENRDKRAQPYNTFHWRIQDANGRVLDPTISTRDDDLGSGDLVSGGRVTGTVSFEVGPGTYYVIYKPKAFDAARGVWQVTV